MRCISCREDYGRIDAGTCKECYEEASETEEELKREIEELKAKVAFLRCSSPLNHSHRRSFSDVILVASNDDSAASAAPVPAHKSVLVSTHFTAHSHSPFCFHLFVYLFMADFV